MRRNPHPRWWTVGLAAVLALAVAACIPEGVRVPQSELSRLVERKSGRIAFLATDGNIYTIDQGGGDRVQITHDAFSDAETYRIYNLPIWSPDSQSLAFVSYMGPRNAAPETVGLHTARVSGEPVAPIEALVGPDFLVYYSWSPDSRRLGLIAQTPNNSLAFKVLPPEGGEPTLVDAGSPYYWSWSPDGSAVLSHAGGTAAAQARLALLQLGSEVIEYGLDIDPATFKAPAFSPDGSRVLVAGRTDDGQSALLLSDALGHNPQVLAAYSGHIAFAWSPNGQRVAYLESPTTALGEPGQVTIVDPNGRRSPITLPEDDIYAFFWSPDSQQLAYFVEEDLPAQEGEAAEAEGAAGQGAADEAPLIFGLRVAQASNGRTHDVAQFLTTERFLSVIPYFDQYHQALTVWSPDSKNLVVSAYRGDGTPGVWVVAASGKLEPRYIADGWMAFWSPK